MKQRFIWQICLFKERAKPTTRQIILEQLNFTSIEDSAIPNTTSPGEKQEERKKERSKSIDSTARHEQFGKGGVKEGVKDRKLKTGLAGKSMENFDFPMLESPSIWRSSYQYQDSLYDTLDPFFMTKREQFDFRWTHIKQLGIDKSDNLIVTVHQCIVFKYKGIIII
jgi:hypothetical protein